MGLLCGPNARSKALCSSVDNVNVLTQVAKGFAAGDKVITKNPNWLEDVHDQCHHTKVMMGHLKDACAYETPVMRWL